MFITFLITLIIIYFSFKLINSKLINTRIDNIDKKVIFITGCDSGIGNATAKYFHKLGFIVFCGCLDPTSKESLELKSLDEQNNLDINEINLINKPLTNKPLINKSNKKTINNRIHLIKIDITNLESILNAVNYLDNFLIKNNELSFHCLINNAGVCIVGEYDWFTIDHIEKIINVNLLGTLKTIKLFLRLLIKYKGRIVTIGSVNGLYSYPGISTYCASKSALNHFSDSLRFELNKFGVKVLILNPGDYSNKTNIMSNQTIYFEQMINNFTDEQQNLYKNYIEKYIKLTNENIGLTGSKNSDRQLFNDLNKLLLLERPPEQILSVPLLNRIILSIYFSLPIKLQLFIFQLIWNRII